MATEIEIKNGMTFEELLISGSDSEDTYGCLLTDLVDQIELATSPGVDSEINVLMEQLVSSTNEDEQHLIANAICDKLAAFTSQIDDLIDKDLDAQQGLREQMLTLNIAAALIPPTGTRNSKLFDQIATDTFKEIIDK